MANGDSSLDRWARIVTQLGLPTVVAGVLLWFVLSRLLHILDVMVADLKAQTHAIQTIERLLEAQEKK
jgi:hypothetical protein